MNHCLNCGKEVKNKFCNISCQNKYSNSERANKKYGKFKIFIVKCSKCNKEIEIEEREKLFPQKKKYYCNNTCSHSRIITESVKKSISKKLTIIHSKKCPQCLNEFKTNKKKKIFCSRSCSSKYNMIQNREKFVKAGLKSVISQNRRSKNEIYFANLCQNEFNNIKTNEPMFNGWDADVIISELKIAILWNGKWHYKKITKKHSLKQVQNRDNIKIKEILKFGFTPYIIKDMGKFNPSFVKEEFNKFKIYCGLV